MALEQYRNTLEPHSTKKHITTQWIFRAQHTKICIYLHITD